MKRSLLFILTKVVFLQCLFYLNAKYGPEYAISLFFISLIVMFCNFFLVKDLIKFIPYFIMMIVFFISGFVIDSIFISLGYIQLPSKHPPLWFPTLWMIFLGYYGDVFNRMLNFPLWLLALLGAIGGSLAYYRGLTLGNIQVDPTLYYYVALIWALYIPLSMRSFRYFNLQKQKTEIPRPCLDPLKPNKVLLKIFYFIAKIENLLGPLILKKYLNKVEIIGKEHLKSEPKLVLMNHTNALDSLILSAYCPTPLFFLVTEPLMFGGTLRAWIAKLLGQIPKRKLMFDSQSIVLLKKWCDLGGSVALFPEGQLTWDGFPNVIQPGLSQLIRYLNVPVVLVKLTNGDAIWPIWADYPRKTTIRLEVQPAKTFSSNEDIEEYVKNNLYVDPLHCTRWEVTGDNLAEGLARFLRFCFHCHSDQSLIDKNNTLKCIACNNSWDVSAQRMLTPNAPLNGHAFSIAKAYSLVTNFLLEKWQPHPELKSVGKVVLMNASKKQWSLISEGDLILNSTHLLVDHFQLPLEEIQAVTLDWGKLLLIRTKTERLAIKMPDDSRAIWEMALYLVLKNKAEKII